MNLEQARALLAKIQAPPTCGLCGAVDPPTKEATDRSGRPIHIHLGCRETGLFWEKVVRWSALSRYGVEDLRDALETIVSLHEELSKLRPVP